jgi:hypothetical protein
LVRPKPCCCWWQQCIRECIKHTAIKRLPLILQKQYDFPSLNYIGLKQWHLNKCYYMISHTHLYIKRL